MSQIKLKTILEFYQSTIPNVFVIFQKVFTSLMQENR